MSSYEKLKRKFDKVKFDINYAESVICSADKTDFKKYNYKIISCEIKSFKLQFN